jgi:hypothetical protein
MVGLGGLLVLVFTHHLCAAPVLVLWVELEKSKKLNLNVRNIFAGSHARAGLMHESTSIRNH